jgi:hypothetical protein
MEYFENMGNSLNSLLPIFYLLPTSKELRIITSILLSGELIEKKRNFSKKLPRKILTCLYLFQRFIYHDGRVKYSNKKLSWDMRAFVSIGE